MNQGNLVNRCLFLLFFFPALMAQAADIDLASRIGPGKWALAYQRTAELKPLHLKHNDNGTSYTCIDGDPRTKILDWLKNKGCTVHKEAFEDNVYRMSGECTLKWWKGEPIPVSVELRPENRRLFTLDIHTEGNSILGFVEHTKATLQGPCDPVAPASAPQSKQNQDGQPQGQTEKKQDMEPAHPDSGATALQLNP
jgi:hypothetical protein